MKKLSLCKFSFSILFVLMLGFGFFGDCAAKDKQTIAILPFEIISPEDISYLQSGILQMLHSRLVWKDHVAVIDKKLIFAQLETIDSENKINRIQEIASRTNSDFVLTGNIIHFSNAFSIDTKVYDIQNKQYLSFFEQSKTIDDVIPKLNIIAAKINKKVFDRKTTAYEKLTQQEKEKAEQLQRQNPEKLIPHIPKGEQEEKSSIWRFWEYL